MVEIFNQVHINSIWIFHLNCQLHHVFENFGSSSQASNADGDSWTLETRPSTRPSVSETSGSLEEDGSSGGDVEGAPNSWCGGSSPAAPSRGRAGFLRQMHGNLSELVQEELGMVDATAIEQAWCLPVLSEALIKKVAVEEELHQLERDKVDKETKALENQFLVTKTVSNKEVWDSLWKVGAINQA